MIKTTTLTIPAPPPMPTRASALIRALVFLPVVMCAGTGAAEVTIATGGGAAAMGCTPRRESALSDMANKKAKCLSSNLNKTPEEILLECGVPRDTDDWRNIYDLIVGMQVAALNAGASLPNATQAAGLAHPQAKDAGAQ